MQALHGLQQVGMVLDFLCIRLAWDTAIRRGEQTESCSQPLSAIPGTRIG